jgi:hypothetical protein
LKEWAGKVALLLVASAICLVFLEVAVRWLFPYFDPHARLQMGLATNGVALGPPMKSTRLAQPRGEFDTLIRWNEDGFRDTRTLREATSEDWIALGDSFTMGWGVQAQERFSNFFEDGLQRLGQSARVFNVATPENFIGYRRMLKYAESRGAIVDHLIVGVCMENDLRDYSDGKTAGEMVPGDSGAQDSHPKWIRNWCKRHTALYPAISFALQRSPFIARQLERTGIVRGVDEINARAVLGDNILKSSRDELLKVVARHDAVILIIPSRRLWHGDNKATEQRMHEEFVRLLREANLNVVDMAPTMEKRGDPLAFYFTTDPHWNARGHALAAELLLEAETASLHP